MELKGKNIIITGGLSGLGRSTAVRLFREGANLAVFDVNAGGFDEIKEELPGISCYQCDVTDYTQVQGVVDQCFEEFGTIDILINNAGILYSEPLVRFSPSGIRKHGIESWHRVLDCDLSSVFYMTVNVVEKMIRKRTRGVIINISSVCSAGNAGQSAYSAAKAGVNALTATWAKELGAFGIRVASVSPGFFDTKSTHDVMSESNLKEVVKEIPIRRLGKAEEVAEGIVSIIKNDYFTGGVLPVTGGLVM